MSLVRARWLFVLLAVIAVLLAWPALNGALLSDDISLFYWLLDWEQKRGIWTTIAAKFGEGLDVPSHYYRPLALISYGLDHVVHGFDARGWHLTTFAMHLLNAALVMCVALRLHTDAWRALTAAAVFVFFPLSAEVSIWSAGRYDALALSGMLIAVYGHLRAQGNDRWRALSLAGFVLGLMAKEAAMTTPGLLVIASFLRSEIGESVVARCLRTLRENIGSIVIFFAYLGFRYALFGSALQVYPGSDPGAALGAGEILARLSALATIPQAVFAGAPMLGLMCLIVSICAVLAAAFIAQRDRVLTQTWLLPLAWTALSLIALVPHLDNIMSTGEGGRFYYATAAWFALLVAGAAGAVPRRVRLLAVVAIAACFASAQRPLLHAWRDAGVAMQALIPELDRAAATLPDDAFALVMVPDHLGPVPFARNAQGGIVMPPLQSISLLPKLVPFVPEDRAQWPLRIRDGLVAQVKGDPAAAPRLDAVFCYDATAHKIIRADVVPDWRDAAAFEAHWREFIAGSSCRHGYEELGLHPSSGAPAAGDLEVAPLSSPPHAGL